MSPVPRMPAVALAAALIGLLAGCANPLSQAKQTYGTGVTSGAFDPARLDDLAKAVQDVVARKAVYGDEGTAQADLMLAYGYVSAGRFDDAAAVVKGLELSVDMTKVSPSCQAFLAVVKADSAYQQGLKLAEQDVLSGRDRLSTLLQSAVDIYEQARTSAALASAPATRQLLALRETDVLISFGNLEALWDASKAALAWTKAVQVSVEAAALGDALRKDLVQRSIEANNLLRAQGATTP